MNLNQILRVLNERTPIEDVPIDWENTGYTTDPFEAWVRSEAFDGWPGEPDTDVEAAAMIRALGAGEGDALLDLACGYGRHAVRFAAQFGLQVTGLDISAALIERARATATAAGLDIDFRVQDAACLDSADTFDHVVIGFCSFSLFGPEGARDLLSRVHRALRPGGSLFLDLDNRLDVLRRPAADVDWHATHDSLVFQEVFFHADTSIEVGRDIAFRGDDAHAFHVFKRLYDVQEISAWLVQAGFRVRALWGDWQLNAYTDDAPQILLVAERA